jgi:hypothetical protein
MSTRCPYCRMVNNLNARRCDGCGYDLVGDASGGQRGSGFSNFFGGSSRQPNAAPVAGTGSLSSRCPYCRAVSAPHLSHCAGCGHPLNAPLQALMYKPPFFERFKNYFAEHWKGMGGAVIVLVVTLTVAGMAISEKTAESAKRARCTYMASGTLDPKYYKVTKTRRIRFIPITSTYYEVTYTFEANGKTYSGKGEMSFEPRRKEIVVKYEPEDPTNNYTESNQ